MNIAANSLEVHPHQAWIGSGSSNYQIGGLVAIFRVFMRRCKVETPRGTSVSNMRTPRPQKQTLLSG